MPKTEAFKKLEKAMKEEYLGEPVPKQYRKRYGKTYDESDIESFSIATAKNKNIQIEK